MIITVKVGIPVLLEDRDRGADRMTTDQGNSCIRIALNLICIKEDNLKLSYAASTKQKHPGLEVSNDT